MKRISVVSKFTVSLTIEDLHKYESKADGTEENMNALVEIRDICKTYNPGENEVRALDHVSLTIYEGSWRLSGIPDQENQR